MTTTVLLADDHKIMRDGLRALLKSQDDMEVVGEAENGRTAVQLARDLRPDVVIMDVGMPDMNGVEATRQIVDEIPGVKVIGLSMHSDRRFVAGMLGAGASGYLLKDCEFDELVRAIRAVAANEIYVSGSVTGVVVEDYVRHLSKDRLDASSHLTPKEREVLQLLAEGRSTKEIASDTHLSVKTIETHRQHIMGKLGVHSVADLTKYAIREGLTSLEP